MSKLNYNRPQFRKNLDFTDYTEAKPLPTQHMDHTLCAVSTAAPHYGKLMCVTCNKFVKWLTVDNFKQYPTAEQR